MADDADNLSLHEMLMMLSRCCKCGQSPKQIMGKLLPCGHVMCIACLQGLEKQILKMKGAEKNGDESERDRESTDDLKKVCCEKSLSCPQCEKPFHAEDPGLSNLQSISLDFSFLNHIVHMNVVCKESCPGDNDDNTAGHFCYDCNGWMCNSCSEKHHQVADTSLHHVVTSEEYSKAFTESFERCLTHSERARVFCCESTCQIPVCVLCLTISHAGHKTVPFSEAEDLIKKRLIMLRKVNKRRQEMVRDNKQRLSAKLADERRKYSETKEQIEVRMEELIDRLERMRTNVIEKGEENMEVFNSDFIVSHFIDRLLKNITQSDTSIHMLLGISRLIKSNGQWFKMTHEDPNSPELHTPSGLTIGVVDPTNDLLSALAADPSYKALLEPPSAHRSQSPSLLRSLTLSSGSHKYTQSNHFVPAEICAYLAKTGEELSQLTTKDTTNLSNNDLGLLVGFYSSAFGWENGILVLSCRNSSKTFKCKRAFSVRYQKHAYSKIAALGSTHLLLADETNRCIVTYTINGREVSTFSFSPHESPRHIEVKDNRLLVSFRHELKIFMIHIVGDMDGLHRVIFVLTHNIRGFEKEHVILEDPHFGPNGQIYVRGFQYPENTTRVREDNVFLSYKVYVIDEQVRSSGKVLYNSCTDMYGIGNISLSPDGGSLFASDYNQNVVMEIPIRRSGKRTTLDVMRSTCLFSNLDGIDKLKSVSVDKYCDLVIVQANDVKIFKKSK